MRRLALIAWFVAVPAAPALADVSGGTAAPNTTVQPAKAGGVAPGSGIAPVAHLRVRARGGRPRISVRFRERGADAVVARIVVLRTPANAVVAQIPVGRVKVGRSVKVPWRGGALEPGRYVVRVHAKDRWSNQLRRSGKTTGKVPFVVRRPKPAPAPEPLPVPSAPPSSSGVFPVAGPVVFGEGFGADRGDHMHEGQDMAAARGTPVVAPLGGTVATTAYQAGGAGYYVVLNASNGRSYFFAHCQKGSVAVSAGQAVVAGAMLCRVGSTGRSSGPHLHFEEWVHGWRTGSKSRPVNPLAQLKAWQR